MRSLIYLAGFITAFSVALPAYLNSSFLEGLVGAERLGLVYAGLAVVSLICLSLLPRWLKRVKPSQVIVYSASLGLLATLVLVTVHNPLWRLASFVAYYAVGVVIYFSLDLILESLSDDPHTGSIRGLYWTAVNFGWLCSPLLAGWLARGDEFERVYLLAGGALIPILLLAHFWQRKLSRTKQPSAPGRLELGAAWRRLFWRPSGRREADLRRILTIEFLLNSFYATMVIFLPIYLRNEIGLPWDQIGIIFTFMLIPFVLVEYPLGRLADQLWGEREILTAGLLIMAMATLPIAFLETKSLAIWALVLFLTRLGAASVEAMKETYLFKKIVAADLNILALSRLTNPLALLTIPLLASVFLKFFPYHWLFLALTLFMCTGLYASLRLTDTR